MWKLFMRLMAPAGADGGGGGGSGSGGGDGGKPGGEAGAGDGKGGTILSGGAGETKLGADGKPIAAAGGAGEDKPWLWADGVPGAGKAPDYYKPDKYKNLGEQAKAALELEGKLGSAATLIGAPAEGKYAVPALPAEIGGEFDPNDPLLKAFQTEAAAMNLSQAAFDRVLLTYARTQAANLEQQELQLSEALTKLGPNVAERVAAVTQFVTAQVGPEGFKALDAALGTNVQAFAAFEKLVALSANDPRLANPSGTQTGVQFTRKDIEAKQFEKYPAGHAMAGKSIYENDAARRAEVDGMWQKLFPGQDQQAVG